MVVAFLLPYINQFLFSEDISSSYFLKLVLIMAANTTSRGVAYTSDQELFLMQSILEILPIGRLEWDRVKECWDAEFPVAPGQPTRRT